MIFDTSKKPQAQKFKERANFLYKKGAKIEIVEKSSKRTYSQNNYLHLILGWFALEYGETLDYIKQEFFKKIVNENLFKYEFINYKTGEVREGWKSTAQLTKAELTEAIERFRNYSAKNMNLYLPEPNDLALLEEIENQLEEYSNKIYL
jgi:hypothetical protein